MAVYLRGNAVSAVKKGSQSGVAYLRGSGLPTPVLPTAFLLEGFNSLTGIAFESAPTGQALSLDTTSMVEGAGCLSFDPNGLAGATNARKNNVPIDFDTVGVICYTVKFDDDYDYQSNSGTTMSFRPAAGGTFLGISGISGMTNLASGAPTQVGRVWQAFHPSEIAGLVALGSGNKEIRVGVSLAAPYVSGGKVDCLLGNAANIPTFVFTYDDARPGQYDNAFPLHQSYDIPMTFYLPTGVIGQANRLTVPQCQTLQAWKGNDPEKGALIALDATPDDQIITTKGTVAAALDLLTNAMTGSRKWLIDNGLDSVGRDFLCYPNGVHHADGAKIQKTDLVTNGTNVVTMGSTTSIVAGMRLITFAGARNLTVLSVDSGTQVTLSGTIPAGVTIGAFVNATGEFHGLKLTDALEGAGFKMGRGTYSDLSNGNLKVSTFYTRYGMGKAKMFHPAQGLTSAVWDTNPGKDVKSLIDYTVLTGATLVFYIHDVFSGATGINTDTALLTQMLAAVRSYMNMGQATALTAYGLWKRDIQTPAVPLS